MTVDGERWRERLQAATEELVVPPGLLGSVREGGRRRVRRRRAAAALATGVLCLAAVLIGAPWQALRLAPPLDTAGTTSPAQPPFLPDRFADHSHLTASVSSSPPGPAVALYQHGLGVELLDLPQAVVVGSAGDVYRRVDLAEDRAGDETQGDPGPMLLSPDGTRVALGTHDSGRLGLALLDLRDGEVTPRPVAQARSVLPVAWSPDGRWLACLVSATATNPHSGQPVAGVVHLVDVSTGRSRPLSGGATATAVAFAPYGTELALQRPASAGGGLEVWSADGALRRTLQPGPGRRLAGPHAWSPDGRLLATSGGEATTSFVDATGGGGPVPGPVGTRAAQDGVLAWASADQVLVLTGEPGPDDSPQGATWVTRVALDGGATERLSALPSDGYGVDRFQLAAALAPDLHVRPAGPAERGPWPGWLRATAALLAAGAVALVVAVVRRRNSRA